MSRHINNAANTTAKIKEDIDMIRRGLVVLIDRLDIAATKLQYIEDQHAKHKEQCNENK